MTYYEEELETDIAWLTDPQDEEDIRECLLRIIKESGGEVSK